MKYTTWIITFFFSFVMVAQDSSTEKQFDSKSLENQKTKHSLLICGGLFLQSSPQLNNSNYHGWSASGAYQIYFPNRFILGFEHLIDRSTIKKGITSGSSKAKFENKIEAYSIGVHLGFQFIRSEKFDFSVLLIPHYNHQKNLRKTSFNDEIGYVNTEYNKTWVFTPILFHRFEFYYKLDKMNGFGLLLDGNLNTEQDLGGNTLLLGRLMFSYRFTVPI